MRSQNKTRLIKANNILVYGFDDGSCGIQINGECFVGEYKTKESALDVLNAIQKVISTYNTENGNYVYEMPLDYNVL